MNPPLSRPDIFSTGTITLMITITFFMQASLIAFSARVIKAYQGVFEASIAAFAMALSFLTLVIGGPPNVTIGYFSNLLSVCGGFLMYLAICRFVEEPPQRWLCIVCSHPARFF